MKQKRAEGKEPICINFDKIVATKLKEKCTREGTKVSTFVNFKIRNIVMDDLAWFEELRKQSALKINEYDYMIDRIKAKKQNKEEELK